MMKEPHTIMLRLRDLWKLIKGKKSDRKDDTGTRDEISGSIYLVNRWIFRETKEKVAYRKAEGCSVVEMECSALAACAAFRDVIWGMILYTADSLAEVDRYDERNWGGNAYEYALILCLDSVLAV